MVVNHSEIYDFKSQQYERLILREDYLRNIPKALNKVCSFTNKDILDLGAGTGRLTCLLAPLAKSVGAFDVSKPMLDITAHKLQKAGLQNWKVGVADHTALPVENQSADIVVAGWSISYVAQSGVKDWKDNLLKVMAEVKRVLRSGGTFIIMETLGTGCAEPKPPTFLEGYYQMLHDYGFSHSWIRTDYQFDSVDEAAELTGFFFGEEFAERVVNQKLSIIPECTGIWWRVFDSHSLGARSII